MTFKRKHVFISAVQNQNCPSGAVLTTNYGLNPEWSMTEQDYKFHREIVDESRRRFSR